MLKFVLLLSKGLIHHSHARRQIMFHSVLGALLMLFLGATVFFGWLKQHPWLFLLYWAACAWITLLAVLLALFDLLLIRAAARRERRRLEAEYLMRMHESKSATVHDPNPPGA